MEQQYILGNYHQCLSLIDNKFVSIRNTYRQPTETQAGRLMHACSRLQTCDCNVLCQYLISIAHHLNEIDVKQFLESQFYIESELRLPFDAFLYWIQLEISRSNFEYAAYLIKNYISQSTRLEQQNESANANMIGGGKDAGQNQYYRGLFGGMRGFNSYTNAQQNKDLPLSKDQYFKLLELLIFFVILPHLGMQHTFQQLKELPMPKHIKTAFEARLTDIRNVVVADIKLTNQEQLLIKGQDQKSNKLQQQANQLNENGQQQSISPEEIQAEIKQQQQMIQKEQQKLRQLQAKRILRAIAGICVVVLFYIAIKRGTLKRFVLWLIQMRLVKWFMGVIFNYKY
ncbi:UNKNOWN [Stylonychia lemnae]|uniref:Uncharacterized protein n=1 Tax=Stylonychia lemnae TaxID=5949 RepID=A0A078B1K0_STYLE|nr:UNKNOWN [Stylonychia lemnae]|eukprot:CDW88440.1 UNKNOWN [Stylonychia lemnae]